MLREQQTRAWHDIVTLDESWFYYITAHELIWLPPTGKGPDREHITIESKKVMLTIAWDPIEFAVVTALESGCKFNAGYYVSKVVTPLSESWRERGGGTLRKLIVHAGNARPQSAIVSQQYMARNEMVIAAHPPYSPDLAPSDFYLFGHVNGLLRGESFETGEQLLSAVEGILRSLEKWTATKVFLEWMTRPERYVEINGDYAW
jgi:histone-lysine N-methyltransferase SETMAR